MVRHGSNKTTNQPTKGDGRHAHKYDKSKSKLENEEMIRKWARKSTKTSWLARYILYWWKFWGELYDKIHNEKEDEDEPKEDGQKAQDNTPMNKQNKVKCYSDCAMKTWQSTKNVQRNFKKEMIHTLWNEIIL